MEIRQLQCFIVVAELLSFRKAAERLRLAQPSVSRRIAELENELGVTLLLRDRQRVQLTDQGRAVLAKARNLVQEVETLRDVARESEPAYLRVGVMRSLANTIQPLVTAYARRFPRVTIDYEDVVPALQGSSLREGKVDVGIFYPPIDYRRLEWEHLFDQPFRVILPRSSHLAKRKLHLRDLKNEVILLLDQTDPSNRLVLQRAEELGVKLKTARASSSPHEAGSTLVASGQGVFVLPGSPVSVRYPAFGSEVAVVSLDEPIAMEVYIAWRKGEGSPHVLNFLETARKVLASGWAREPDPPPAD